MIRQYIQRLVDGCDLTREESSSCMNEIMSGLCTDAQIASYLTALRLKGETVEEIIGAAVIMRGKVTPIRAPKDVVDTCGTGGDSLHTFNISTCAALVAAGAGAKVAKHGNRSVSSCSGSSQVLDALGVNINAGPDTVSRCIEEAGIGFLFAPLLHEAMKHAIGPRREIGVRTIFNILGPLTNPAGAKLQLVGVYSSALVDSIALVLQKLGAERAMVVHGHDGLDEITTTGETAVAFLDQGEVKSMVLGPEDFGMKRAHTRDLQVKSPEESAAVIRGVLAGKGGAAADIVILNAGAALYVAGVVQDLEIGVKKARESIHSGAASDALERLILVSQE